MTPVESALLRIADNVARHIMQRSGWTADDVCFRVDLRKAEAEIEAVIAEAIAHEREACISIMRQHCAGDEDVIAAIRKRGKP